MLHLTDVLRILDVINIVKAGNCVVQSKENAIHEKVIFIYKTGCCQKKFDIILKKRKEQTAFYLF